MRRVLGNDVDPSHVQVGAADAAERRANRVANAVQAGDLSAGKSPTGHGSTQFVRSAVEAQTGRDLSDVQTHSGHRAATLAKRLNARAFAVGQHVVLGEEKGPEWRSLLAHEFAHVATETAVASGRLIGRQRDEGAGTATAASPAADREPEYVYLASGDHLTPQALSRVEDRTRRLFRKYRITLEEDWMVRHTEDGSPVLLLRWQPGWGEPPSRWMGPDKLEAFLYRRFATESVELGTQPYDEEASEREFTAEQRRWILEVVGHPLVSLLLRTMGDLPPVVLHRVKLQGASHKGQSSGDKVALGAKLTDKQEFQETLIHELVHFIDNQQASIADWIWAPTDLEEIYLNPEAYGFPPYAFGWFVHPDSRKILHFDAAYVGRYSFIDDRELAGHPDLVEAHDSEDYEASPMHTSGSSISIEEDISETVARFIVSPERRSELESDFPHRYQLMRRYFGRELPTAERRRLGTSE